jgi:hypothetical protein
LWFQIIYLDEENTLTLTKNLQKIPSLANKWHFGEEALLHEMSSGSPSKSNITGGYARVPAGNLIK